MRTGDPSGRSAIPLAAVCHGSPVRDARGAPIGRVVDVGTATVHAESLVRGEPPGPWPAGDARQRLGYVRVSRYGPGGTDIVIAADRIAYVADDHVRLSVTADDVIFTDEPF
ncbi:hypothetical protein E1218_34510 [Kribbella turkmenica]|uniref:Uncharacterized protein n=1 Tax=Kribbella turkmenica TaxID=2530375 RepID=A0A4R4WDI5_9ACTN|nr:hypothetical protein [Kribbella turkmenica]TDD13445.1 hypothetical protein E1218_34510 [Kribbella turkmenica]